MTSEPAEAEGGDSDVDDSEDAWGNSDVDDASPAQFIFENINFGPSFSVTAGSIGANKHGPCMQDCGSVGGRTQHHGEDRSNSKRRWLGNLQRRIRKDQGRK